MHSSAYRAMARNIDAFVPKDRPITVLDVGSGTTEDRIEKGLTHGALFVEHDAEIIGVDIIEGPNVDRVLTKPYRYPVRTNSVDVVVSGQVFEHVPFFWAAMFEVARVLKPGGIFIMTVPSRGHKHMLVDCWRYYDDGVRAMAAFTGLHLKHARTDYVPARPGERRYWDYPADRTDPHYWGDTVGVFEKPLDYPTRRMAAVRGPIVWWANKKDPAFMSSIEKAAETRQRQRRRRERMQREA